MNLFHAAACLSLLVGAAQAQTEAEVIFRATLPSLPATPPPAPFTNAQVGDAMEARFKVSLPGTPAVGGGLEYAVDWANSSLTIGGASSAFSSTPAGAGALLADDDNTGAAFDQLGGEALLVGDLIRVGAVYFDFSIINGTNGVLLTHSDLALTAQPDLSFASGIFIVTDDATNTVIFEQPLMDSIEIVVGGAAGIGSSFCGGAVPNTTGVPAAMTASGSRDVAMNDVLISCSDLPTSSFGFFIVSQAQGFVMNPGGSSGNLCLSGSVGRYVGPGQVQSSGAAGQISLQLDLNMIPQPNGLVSATSGETWNWQTWYRDSTPGGTPTSNFSDGLQIDFL